MTAIVCFNWSMAAVLLGDSRLSYRNPAAGNIVTVRDLCQKVWAPNGWSALGFAGDVCLGNSLAGAFYGALRDKKWSHDHVLTDDAAIKALALATVEEHARTYGAGHARCREEDAALLFVYVGLVRFNKADGSFDFNELGTITVVVTSDGTIQRSGLGAALLGDGAELIRPKLTLDRMAEAANAGSAELQTLYALLTTAHYIDTYKAKSVGVPFQAVRVSPRGVEVVPYFYWAQITHSYGT